MPWTAFSANGLWVLVIGLMGPSVPFIIREFSINYSQAGLIFTVLSFSSFIGTFLGGWVSDYKRRRVFWMLFLAALSAGLVVFANSHSFFLILLTVFFMSLFGSPIGAVGQSIMLQVYPDRRRKYLSLSTMFAAAGSFIAPLLISSVCVAGFEWRAAFLIVSAAVLVLLIIVASSRLPEPAASGESRFAVFGLYKDKRIVFAGLMIFICVGFDLGFSYWLAEYFISSTGTAAEYSGFAVGCYLIGVVSGRLLNSRRPESSGVWMLPAAGLAVAAVSLVLFLNIDIFQLKLFLCLLYGLGIGPSFPSMMAMGTSLYPQRSGAATAVLFSMMSLSGAVFPMIIGTIGRSVGIDQAYYALLIVMLVFGVGILIRKKFA